MIDWVNTLLTSVSMSIDAMTVNATNGLKEKGMPIWKMLLISLSYGIFQFLMPCIGYFVGFSFKDQLEKYIPWIAFTLLGLLAIKSFIDWIKDFKKRQRGNGRKRRDKEDWLCGSAYTRCCHRNRCFMHWLCLS